MPSLGMQGIYRFDTYTIDNMVRLKRPGNYALGWVMDNGVFVVSYVGRSDNDLNQEMKSRFWARLPEYTHFKFKYAVSELEAFQTECWNYHDFGENLSLINSIHPASPRFTDWQCPHFACVFSKARAARFPRFLGPPTLADRLSANPFLEYLGRPTLADRLGMTSKKDAR